VEFFKEQGICGQREMLDVGELVTYERKNAGDCIINFGDNQDKMYIILDGKVDFKIDLYKSYLKP